MRWRLVRLKFKGDGAVKFFGDFLKGRAVLTAAAGFLFAVFSVPAWAVTMSGGNCQISRTSLNGGWVHHGDGLFALNSPDVTVGVLRATETLGASTGLYEGIFPNIPSGLTLTAALSSLFTQRVVEDWILGIGINQYPDIYFSKPILPDTLYGAVSANMVRNRLAVDATGYDVLISTAYEADDMKLTVSAASGSWTYNNTYRVVVSTEVSDEDGLTLAEPYEFVFQTVLNPDQDNIVKPVSDDGTRIVMDSGFASLKGHVEITTAPVYALADRATEKFEHNNPGGRIHSIKKINFLNESNQVEALTFSKGRVTLYIPYIDENGDGYIDGTNSPVSEAALYVLDESSDLWIRLAGSEVSSSSSAVYALPAHFSYFAMGTARAGANDMIYAYPSPFRPHGPNAGTSDGQTGTEAGGITFVNLPGNAQVSVYTVRGELVWQGDDDGSGKLNWNARNRNGEKAASGVYIFLVKSSDGKRTGKFAIIR